MRAIELIGRFSLRGLIVLALTLQLSSTARAASVAVGNHLLMANTPNQTFTIQITGGEQVAGEDFFAQIGDGGAYNNGVNSKPSFANVDIIGGTIFAANNNGPQVNPTVPNSAHPLIWEMGTVTASGSVAATGKLATLTIDTTGLSSGTFPLVLTGVGSAIGPNNNTILYDASAAAIPLAIANGSLMISTLPLADFNHNGIADAADYTIWRNTLGQTGPGLAADADGNNIVDQADYNVWKSQFGFTAGSGSGAGTGKLSAGGMVPEPSACLLAVLAGLTLAGTRFSVRFARCA
jgi:hypothetical protein